MDDGRLSLTQETVESIVVKVMHAVASACKLDQAPVLTVFTGATAGFTQALSGLEQLMLNGNCLEILSSDSADHLYGDVIKERLMAWPTASPFDPSRWFAKVQKCSGVVVPMLSVATLSKVCAMTPDTLASNIILQAMFMGKPVVAAIDGAAPSSPDRAVLGLGKGTPALNKALADRLIQFSDFGGSLALAKDLGRVGLKALNTPPQAAKSQDPPPEQTPAETVRPLAVAPSAQVLSVPAKLVDAAMVRQARNSEPIIRCAPGAIVTPLARELASQFGIDIRLGASGI